MDKEEQKKIFAENLRNYEYISQKSKSEIAKAIGSLPSAYTSWVQGISLPRMDKIQALANLFSVTVSDLLDKHDDNYSIQTAELSNILRKDVELANEVYKLSKLSVEERSTIYATINLLYDKQVD